MSQEFENLNYFELHTLLINMNKEFTNGIKAGKNYCELQNIYNSIHEVYAELRKRKAEPIAVNS